MKRILLLAVFALALCRPAHAAITFKDSACNGSADNYSASVDVDTTDGTLFVVIHSYAQASGANTITDDGSNMWDTSIPAYCNTSANCVRLVFVDSNTPTMIGAGHTVFASDTFPLSTYPGLCAFVFDGSAMAPFDDETGNNDGSNNTSNDVGPLTPSENDTVVISGISWANAITDPTLAAPFTGLESYLDSTHTYELAGGYVIQTTATAATAEWDWMSGSPSAGVIAAFKSDGGGGGGGTVRHSLSLTGVGM